jgi:ATP-dependent exoDNAse (exonuclease V) beta subunit
VWLRGIVDLLVVGSDSARIIDYKTSKSSKYADTKQLELLSLLVFKHFPNVKKIKAALLFLVSQDLVRAKYTEEQQSVAWIRWLDIVKSLEAAMKVDVWNPKPNFTCRKFCAVKDCEHNGRSPY